MSRCTKFPSLLLGLVFPEQRFRRIHVMPSSSLTLSLPKLILFRQVRITLKRLWPPAPKAHPVSYGLDWKDQYPNYRFSLRSLSLAPACSQSVSRRQNVCCFSIPCMYIHHFIGVLNPSSRPPRTSISRFFGRLGAALLAGVLVCSSHLDSLPTKLEGELGQDASPA